MSTPVDVLRVNEKLSTLIHHTKADSHHGYPVVDDYDPEGYDKVCQTAQANWKCLHPYHNLEK